MEGRGKIAYDPRDFENGNTDGMQEPKLTIMEEILLLGLKDKAVSPSNLNYLTVRATYHSGMTTSHTPFEAVSSSN